MRKYLFFLLIWICVLPAFSAERKKVGLVLGGGGAKGVSHIGVLKVLEEADIPIDYIAGTSMGAIVGGLYAVGYDATTIDSMLCELDWTMLLSDRVKRSSRSFPEKENSERYILSLPFGKEKKDRVVGGVIKGQNLLNLFSNLTIGYHDSVDFNSFHIPFACVALNAVDGSDYVFRKGSLPLAMRASMAIPAAFTPVRIDSMVLIDGGVSNNYPADVALDMGADILIGVDLGTSDLKVLEKLNTPGDVIGQLLALYGHEKYSRNKDSTDLLIRPNVEPYHAASFIPAAIDTLINRGEQAARQQWDEILALKERIGITDTTQTFVEQNFSYPAIEKGKIFIRNIFFEGADPRDENWLRRICKLKENRVTSVRELEEVISILIGTNAYSNVSYKLIGEEQQDLVLIVQEKAISSLNAGLRFDTEEIVAVLLNATFTYRSTYRSKFALTGRIGKQSYARLDYGIERTPLRNFNLSYKFAYNDLNFYNQGDKVANTTYRHHFAEFGYSDMNWLNFKFNAGLRYEYYDYDSFLYNEGNHDYSVKPEGFVNYFVNVHLETFDRGYFPESGVSLLANYTVYTDDFVTYKDHTPFSALGVGFSSVIRLNSHLSLLPSLDSRILIGRDPAYPYLNAVGGEVYHKYLPQQLPFAGINNIEIFDNSVVLARVNLRQRIGGRHYLSLIGNYGVHNRSFFDLLDGEHVWGVSLGYAYNSVAGPLSVSLGNSNRNDNTQFYLNLGYNF